MSDGSKGSHRTATLRALLLACPLLAASALPACSNMQGVNVGASVPIGGIGRVGANTTVGQRPARAPAPEPPAEPADGSGREAEEESSEEGSAEEESAEQGSSRQG